jgi:TldD protein
MKDLTDIALDAAQAGGASYCDVRIQRQRLEMITAREEKLEGISSTESYGAGVRVLLDGTWGFAASAGVSGPELAGLARSALHIARANRALQNQPVQLAPVAAYRDTWRTPVEQDPFAMSVSSKVDLLLDVNRAALEAGGDFVHSHLYSVHEWKYFASSSGSNIEQDLVRIWPSFSVTAVDRHSGEFKTRSSMAPSSATGYELTRRWDLVAEAARAAEEARCMLGAATVEPGRRDLILHPTNLWLTIHESVGHATELDRVLGFEANYAGTSFATLDKIGRYRYGSPIVNFYADRTQPTGLATVGYDDEGVRSTRWDLVRDGILVDYQTVREQASSRPYLEARRAAGLAPPDGSYGCSYADSFHTTQIQRMPNVSLQPGAATLSLEDIVADTDDGILVRGDGSWSIDQQRYNFQFGGQTFWEVKRGKITRMLRDVAYQSNTQEFWNSCDAIASAEHYELNGSFFCGKGEPTQLSAVSHGCAPARFRQIRVLNTGSKR